MIWALPLQAVLIVIDEMIHRKRILPKWERIGHPVDTAFFILPMIYATRPAPELAVYIALAVLSTLIVTKDEFIHGSVCKPFESWLHALLFIVHPLALMAVWELQSKGEITLICAQIALTSLFLLYQIFYWNPLPHLTRSTVQHLRFGFSIFLAPVFFFALTEIREPSIWKSVVLFLVLIFGIFPASNGYNSYYDRDETSIGGLEKPPLVHEGLLFYSWLVEIAGLLVTWTFFGWAPSLLLAVYGIFSKLYSHPRVRLKKYPWASWAVVATCQGALIYWACLLALNPGEVFSWRIAVGMVMSSLLIGSSYPITQIYQHNEDLARGDQTLSLWLGVRGTIWFSTLTMAMAITLMVVMWGFSIPTLLFFILTLPVGLYMESWRKKIWQDSAHADFQHTHRFLKLSSTCAIAAFLVVFLWRYHASAQARQILTEGISVVRDSSNKPWFQLRKYIEGRPNGSRYEVEFTDSSNQVLSREVVDLDKEFHLENYTWKDEQSKSSAQIQVKNGKVKYTYNGKSSEEKYDLKDINRLVVPPLLADFALKNWDRIEREGSADLLLLVPDRMETFRFRFENSKDHTFILRPVNWVVRLALAPIYFDFDGAQRIKRIRNVMPPIKLKSTSGELADTLTDINF